MRYAKEENGIVRVYNKLPKMFVSDTEANIQNFHRQNIDVINSKGYYEIVEPSLEVNQRYEALIPSDLDLTSNKYIKRIYTLKQAEIDVNIEREEENSVRNIINKRIDDGLNMLRKVERKLYRLHKKGSITENQYYKLQEDMIILCPLQVGHWKKVEQDLLVFPDYNQQPKTDALNKIKESINEYMLSDYE